MNPRQSTTQQNDNPLENILNAALQEDLSKVAPTISKSAVTDEETNKILDTISSNFQIKKTSAAIAIYLLFLKGAASNGTPLSLIVEVEGKDISKRDLLNAYSLATGNTFLRRLAESLAIPIGQFAEKNGLRGELAQRMEKLSRSESGQTLTAKELAWCSSFSQVIPNLDELASQKVSKLLADDYNTRFIKQKRTPVKANTEKNFPSKKKQQPKQQIQQD
jgi:hypothetical protein